MGAGGMTSGERSVLRGLGKAGCGVAGPEPVADASGDIGGMAKAVVKKDAGGRAAANSFFADQDDLPVRVQLICPLPDLS